VAYDFFFSYPRREAKIDPYLKQFYDDLSNEIRRLRGTSDDPGFIDHDIAGGEDWQRRLVKALNESKTFLAMLMPAYYNSDNCMRELELFESRIANLQPQYPLIRGVFWLQGEVQMPAKLQRLQYTYGDPTAPINLKGVLYARKKRLGSYGDLIERLARDIVRAANQPELPGIAEGYQHAQPRQADPIDITGPDHVHFVYVATSADKPPQRIDAAAYGVVPKSWRPFHPPTTSPIAPLTQAAASSIEFSSDELPFDRNLVNAIREAERKRNLVVLIVDGWSMQLAGFDEVLRMIDEQNFVNAAFVVPLNENDPETAARTGDLRDAVRASLYRWSTSKDKLRFDDSITKLEQLKRELPVKILRLRAKVFNAGRGRPTPAVSRPTLTNTGTGS